MGIAIEGSVALVTGGARGIGASIAACLAEAGARVMVADIGVAASTDTSWRYDLASQDDLEATLAQAPGRIKAIQVDVCQAQSCAQAVAATIAEFGRVDILVNNAGLVDSGPVATFDPEAWDRLFAVNCRGIFLMSQACLPHLLDAPNPCIVNISSVAGKRGHANLTAYCGSKFAAIGITQSMAAELAPQNVRVNAVCPGMVGTAMWLDFMVDTDGTSMAQRESEFLSVTGNDIPLGRPQTVRDIGEAVLYLVGAENVSGVSLNVAGGYEVN